MNDTIYSANRDTTRACVQENKSSHIRAEGILSIIMNVTFNNTIPTLQQTFVYDETEGVLDENRLIADYIHDYVSAWYWKREWAKYNGDKEFVFNRYKIFETKRKHLLQNYLQYHDIVNQYRSKVDVKDLKTGDLLYDIHYNIQRVYSNEYGQLMIYNDLYNSLYGFNILNDDQLAEVIATYPKLMSKK